MASDVAEMNSSVFWVITRRKCALKPTFLDWLSFLYSRVKLFFFLDRLTLEDGADRQSRNVGFKAHYAV